MGIVILGIFVFAIIGAVVWFFLINKKKEPSVQPEKSISQPSALSMDEVPKENEKGLEELKYKAGDWVVDRFGDVWHIDSFDSKNYQMSNGDKYCRFPVEKQNEMHLWTIEDAKDGDVLHSTGWHGDCIFIFNGLDNWKFDEPNGDRAVATGYCCLTLSADNMEFGIQGPDCIEVDTVKPATKIQHNLLFQKMKDAGYEWNALYKLGTLEVKEVDLDREIDDYINEHFSECDDGVLISDANSKELALLDITPLAKHFFELGLSSQLSWQDVKRLAEIGETFMNSEESDNLSEEEYYTEILNKFKAQKGE